MALLGRAGAAAVEILETGAVLVGRLCENSVKKRHWLCLLCASGAVEHCPCFFIPVLLLLYQLLPLLVWAVSHACVCACVVNKCVMFSSLVGNGTKLTD